MNLETVLRPYLDVYKTPAGHVDEFYILTYSPPSTTPADSILLNQYVNVSNGPYYYDFLLRRVVGLDSVIDTTTPTGQYTLQTDGNNNMQSNPISVGASGLDMLVIPEILFQSNGQIGLSLYKTAIRQNNSGGQTIFYGQVAFQGIRRRVGKLAKPGVPYRLVPWQTSFNVAINWSGLDAGNNAVPPHKFYVDISNFDTEVYAMQVFDPLYSPDVNSQSSCALTLYNAQKMQMSNAPVVASYLSAAFPWGGTPGQSGVVLGYPGGGVFTPTILYPQESQIEIDVTSLLLTAQLPVTVTITLTGAQRFPC